MKSNLQIRRRAKSIWIWLQRKDAFIFLLFVGLTSIFWWGRMMSSPRDIEMTIPVTYSGYSDQVIFDCELPKELTLQIHDIGHQLRSLLQKNLSLNIDLSPYIREKQGNVTLSDKELNSLLKKILPSSTSIKQIKPIEIKFGYIVQQCKTVPIKLQAKITPAYQYQFVGNIEVVPSSVQIFGEQSAIDAISSINTEDYQAKDLRTSLNTTLKLIVPSGIRVQPSVVTLKCAVEQLTEKTFTLPVTIENPPADKEIQIYPEEVKVTVRVGLPHYDEISANDLRAFCHYSENGTDELSVELEEYSPYISDFRVSPSSVKYKTYWNYEEDSNGGSADTIPTY